jgi:prophage antirepressor-like protein
MLVVNELGIYEALFASRRPEARKFRRWTTTVMKKLRTYVGLQGYEALRLTEDEIQEQIDDILDCLFVDPETNQLMISVTVQGGDVDQIPFDEYMQE